MLISSFEFSESQFLSAFHADFNFNFLPDIDMRFRTKNETLIVETPAKINLYLNILGKRSDGFHELETVMVSIGLYDTLTFMEEPFDTISLRCFDAASSCVTETRNDQSIPEGTGNLVVKAANLLKDYAGTQQGVRIRLHKRIPAAAGLAGGSSDAAATLVGLNRFWNLGLSIEELHTLAAQLGSDVNFFLSPTISALCRGRGEQIQPLNLPCSLHLVLVRPQSGLSTAAVFQHWKPTEQRNSVEKLRHALTTGHWGELAQHLHNSLQEPALELNSDVRHLRDCFSRLPVLGHCMSGSGTTWFGLCRSQIHARHIAARLHAQRIGSVFVAQSLS